jgi:hypothetical protein
MKGTSTQGQMRIRRQRPKDKGRALAQANFNNQGQGQDQKQIKVSQGRERHHQGTEGMSSSRGTRTKHQTITRNNSCTIWHYTGTGKTSDT